MVMLRHWLWSSSVMLCVELMSLQWGSYWKFCSSHISLSLDNSIITLSCLGYRYVFNIAGALPWHFLPSLIAFCQFLTSFTRGRGRCCKDISELSPVSATNPHFPCSSFYCLCNGRSSSCLWYSLHVRTPAGLWLSQHYPYVPMWYLCVHPFSCSSCSTAFMYWSSFICFMSPKLVS